MFSRLTPIFKQPQKHIHLIAELVPYFLRVFFWGFFSLFDFLRHRPTNLDKPFCSKPFEWFEVKKDGNAYLCCSGWLPISIGNIFHRKPEAIWNSWRARQIRRSILDGSYAFCIKNRCPHLQRGDLPTSNSVQNDDLREIISMRRTQMSLGPKTINAGYDATCNLSCPSCRTGLINASKKERYKAESVQEKLLSWGAPGLESLYVTGSGDPFASRVYRRLLTTLDPQDFPNLKLKLHTNALLFTPRMWESMHRVHSIIESMEVSIDAAKGETYRIVRRGGEFEILLIRLKYIQEIRQKGFIRHLQFSFVVQAANFREMADFVRLGLKFGSDTIYFSGLSDWGTYDVGEYNKLAIHIRTHPHHGELLRILKDPIFDHPKVYFANIASLRARTWRPPNSQSIPLPPKVISDKHNQLPLHLHETSNQESLY